MSAPTECEHCGKPISQCSFGCWHHDDERASIFCGQFAGKFAEPRKQGAA